MPIHPITMNKPKSRDGETNECNRLLMTMTHRARDYQGQARLQEATLPDKNRRLQRANATFVRSVPAPVGAGAGTLRPHRAQVRTRIRGARARGAAAGSPVRPRPAPLRPSAARARLVCRHPSGGSPAPPPPLGRGGPARRRVRLRHVSLFIGTRCNEARVREPGSLQPRWARGEPSPPGAARWRRRRMEVPDAMSACQRGGRRRGRRGAAWSRRAQQRLVGGRGGGREVRARPAAGTYGSRGAVARASRRRTSAATSGASLQRACQQHAARQAASCAAAHAAGAGAHQYCVVRCNTVLLRCVDMTRVAAARHVVVSRRRTPIQRMPYKGASAGTRRLLVLSKRL
uniref:Uncharacterized protein n=1 Tax=Heliothis virescens TaxID=7102 RepID=A0A2A4IX49_HELVI